MYYLKEEIERLKNLSGMHELNARGKAKLKEFEELLIIVQNQGQELPIDSVVGKSEQLKPMVFELANKLAIAGEGDAAVGMHRIHNRL